MTNLLPGADLAQQIQTKCKEEVSKLQKAGHTIKLAFILAGDNHASSIYIGRKRKACAQIGMVSHLEKIDGDATTKQIIATVEKFNQDVSYHGILVQLPLPSQVDASAVLNAVDPTKDVDGLHPTNLGMLAAGLDNQPIACTPQGCLYLLQSADIEISKKHAVVVGRSRIVGRPMSLLLLNKDATVTTCHSQTADLKAECLLADILIVACGSPKLIKADMIKEGAAVIDVGINGKKGSGLCGDVDFDKVKEVAGYITPVPGGVGPLTVAMLMKNTVQAAKKKFNK